MPTNIEIYNAKRKAEALALAQQNGLRPGSAQTHPKTFTIRKSSSVSASEPPDARPDPAETAQAKAHIRATLKKYLAEQAQDHAYVATNSLRAARLDVNQRAENIDPQSERVLALDGVSPFLKMRPIEKIVNTFPKDLGFEMGRFSLRHYPQKPTVSTAELKLVCKPHIAPRPPLPKLPKYHGYTTLRNNILTEDDEFMRYFPYFGEDAAENDDLGLLNLEEAFIDRTKNADKDNQKAEQAMVYTEWIRDFLKELDTDLNTILNYLIGDLSHTGWSKPRIKARDDLLPDDFDPTDSKIETARKRIKPVSIKELEKAEPICVVFEHVTGVSLWEVSKREEESVKSSLSPARSSGSNANEQLSLGGIEAAQLSGGNPAPYSVESYMALNCLYCYMHECPFHVNPPRETADEAGTVSAIEMRLKKSCLGSRKAAFGEDEICCSTCFVQASDEDKKRRSTWSKAQVGLLTSASIVLKENPRAACHMACVINKPCYEIQSELERRNLLSEPEEHTTLTTVLPILPAPEVTPTPPSLPKANNKRKRTIFSDPKKPHTKSKTDYPADCAKTALNMERTYFKPCVHEGPCSSATGCSCYKSKTMCEKSCLCAADCPRRWKGCNCAASSKACHLHSNCPCVKWHRECDPDLCLSCGASETLSPSNRYNEEMANNCCQNVALQRDIPRRTLLGISGVSGLGLFIGENAKAYAFLGEYKGEIISHDEAERRGKLYDKRGVSFLFNLNSNQVIDATRAGNKFRFVNHFRKPNCIARVVFANCTHRIGMFAKRDLVAGEELYFDYGYNNKSVQFIAQEPEYYYVPASVGNKNGPGKKRILRTGNYNTGHTARTVHKPKPIQSKSSSISAIGARLTVNSGGLTTAIATVSRPSINGRSIAVQAANGRLNSPDNESMTSTALGGRNASGRAVSFDGTGSIGHSYAWEGPEDEDSVMRDNGEENISDMEGSEIEVTEDDAEGEDAYEDVLDGDEDHMEEEDDEVQESSSEDEYAPNRRDRRDRRNRNRARYEKRRRV